MTCPSSLCCPHCPARQTRRPDADVQDWNDIATAYSVLGIGLGLVALLIAAFSIAGKFDGYTAPGDEPAQTITALGALAAAALLLPLGAWSLLRARQAAAKIANAQKQRRLAKGGCL